MMKVELIFAGLMLAAPAASRGGAAPERPDAGALLVAAFSAPTKGCVARGRIQSFAPGRKPKALAMTVYFLPDGRLRREVRALARRPPEQIFIDDGSEQSLYWPKLGTLWKGKMAHEAPAEGAARLESLYDVSVSTGGRVAKHATWRLDLRAPDGSLRRALWVDRASGLLLKCEEYRLDGTLLRRERLTALEVLDPDAGLFRLDVPPGTPTAAMTEPRGPVVPGALFPRWIPDGFLALSSSVEESGPGRTLVVGYGDGVEAFTFRETSGVGVQPDRGGETGRSVRLKDGSRATLLSGKDGPLLEFRSAGRAYSIAGGITEDEMLRMADSVAGAAP
jgi:hypothetical protein